MATFMGIRGIEASSTYELVRTMLEDESYAKARAQGYFEPFSLGWGGGWCKGSLAHARRILIELGTQRFGAPPEQVISVVQAMDEIAQIDARIMCVLTATSWDELMAPPASD